MDFGFSNPYVCQFWAQDHDGRLYLYKEIYKTQTLVEDHARHMLALVKKGDGHRADLMPQGITCDHDAEGRATLETHLGMATSAAHKSVMEGIEAVKARLKVQPDGKPRLYICRDAVVERDPALEDAKKPASTQDEILGYVWNDRTKREEPRKEHDHGMDAMRYVVAAVDLVGQPRVRWFRTR